MLHRVMAAGATVLIIGVSACSTTESAGGSPVLAPGAPGGSASPASQQRIDSATEELQHNEADVDYMLMMIEHHSQALEMTDLAPDRVGSGPIEKIADRISDTQDSEITVMEAWLENNVYAPARQSPGQQSYCEGGGDADKDGARPGDVDCPTDLDHESMPGMASPAELDALEAAQGEEFDELFVDLMTAHHEGGISMAEDAVVNGSHPDVVRMAGDLIAEQRAEITRMETAAD